MMVTKRDIARRGAGHCVQVEDRHGYWEDVSGDACGWTLTGAKKAARAFARLLDSPASIRVVRSSDRKVVWSTEAHEHWEKR